MSDAITGRTLEQLVIFRAQKLEEQGILTLGRYGTMVVMMNDEHGIPRWQPKPSLPDLEGVIAGSGRQLILELKACSQASYPIYGTDRKRPRQIEHMMKRAKFGALCYIMIHFNQRDLKTKYQGAFTIAIPVHRD
jgi:penicillin-binding protein-related factor A (putative recombinase)